MLHLKGKGKQEKQRIIRGALDAFAEAVAAGVGEGDEDFARFLAFAARFHKYSWRNCLLIAWQAPEASFVAGYRRWQDLGRHVRKGARGIWILAPRTYTKKTQDDEGQEKEESHLYFTPVSVFADYDTEGEGEIPNFRPHVAEAADLFGPLLAVADSWGVQVIRQGCAGNGWSDGERVNVKPGLPDAIAAQTLAHELAHHHLKHLEREDVDRALAEGEAEAVKVVVLQAFGVDVASNGAAYLRRHGADADGVKRSAGRIVATAEAIIDGLTEAMEASQQAEAEQAEAA